MSFVCPVYAFSFCSVLFSSLFFFFRWLFCKEKVTKKHRNFVCVDACTPPPAPKVPPPSPLCFPTTLWSIFALISQFPVLYTARIFGPIFHPQKVLAFCTPTKVPPTLPRLPPQPCVIPSLSRNVLQPFDSLLFLTTLRFAHIKRQFEAIFRAKRPSLTLILLTLTLTLSLTLAQTQTLTVPQPKP